MDKLPEELIDQIIDEVSLDTLPHIYLVCKKFARIAKPHLKNIVLADFGSMTRFATDTILHSQAHELLDALKKDPKWGPKVRKLVVRHGVPNLRGGKFPRQLRSRQREPDYLLWDIVQHFPNMEILNVAQYMEGTNDLRGDNEHDARRGWIGILTNDWNFDNPVPSYNFLNLKRFEASLGFIDQYHIFPLIFGHPQIETIVLWKAPIPIENPYQRYYPYQRERQGWNAVRGKGTSVKHLTLRESCSRSRPNWENIPCTTQILGILDACPNLESFHMRDSNVDTNFLRGMCRAFGNRSHGTKLKHVSMYNALHVNKDDYGFSATLHNGQKLYMVKGSFPEKLESLDISMKILINESLSDGNRIRAPPQRCLFEDETTGTWCCLSRLHQQKDCPGHGKPISEPSSTLHSLFRDDSFDLTLPETLRCLTLRFYQGNQEYIEDYRELNLIGQLEDFTYRLRARFPVLEKVTIIHDIDEDGHAKLQQLRRPFLKEGVTLEIERIGEHA